MINSWKILFLVTCVAGVTACSSSSPDEFSEGTDAVEQVESAQSIYDDAQTALDKKNYRQAISKFQEVERLHPYSKWATKAQMMAAYTAYEQDSYEEAILALDRFVRLHPGNEDVDYALYLKAMSYYQQISDVSRDQEITKQALKSFNALVKRFPNSEYTRDAKLKRDLTMDHLAGKEMEVGRYYLNRNEVNAAINRFRAVVTNFQTTTHIPEALHRLVESYLILGLKAEARQVAAVLGHNYPGSKWYEDSYKILDEKSRQQILDDRSFVDKTVDTLFKPN
jgi:outer membrane protein assembly factor BamD